MRHNNRASNALHTLGLLLAITAGCADDEAGAPAIEDDATTGDIASTGDVSDDPSDTDAEEETSGGDESSTGEPGIQPDFDTLAADLEALRMSNDIPGVAMGIVQGDTVLWTQGFGVREEGTDTPIDADTPFRLASVSKTVVGAALMRAEAMDILSLDDTIEMDFAVNNPHVDGEAITYRSLANHQSGIVDSLWYECAYTTESGDAYMSPEEQGFCPEGPTSDLEGFLAAYLEPDGALYTGDNFAEGDDGQPGTTYNYSNVGAALAGASLGRATQAAVGMDFPSFCDAEIFAPLGMTNTAWRRTDLPAPDEAAVPHMTFGGTRTALDPYHLATFPDGGLYSSVNDLSRFLAAMVPGAGSFDGTEVLPSEQAAALTDFIDVSDGDIVDGQGIFWERYLGLYGHTGGDPGVSTAMGYDPETGVGYILLINETGPTTELFLLQALARMQEFAAEEL